jgi:hypothetical protein
MNSNDILTHDNSDEAKRLYADIFEAAATDDVEILARALERGERLDTQRASLHNRNPMHLACIAGSAKFFAMASQNPTFNPFLFDDYGRRPIEYAHAYNRREMEIALLDLMYPPPAAGSHKPSAAPSSP